MYNIIIIESNSMKAVLITKETFRFNDEDNYVCKTSWKQVVKC